MFTQANLFLILLLAIALMRKIVVDFRCIRPAFD